MESYALPLYLAGHIPLLGEWIALPLVHLAGSKQVGDEAFNRNFHPIAERLLQHCDAVLRVGGSSSGADLMTAVAQRLGLRVFHALRMERLSSASNLHNHHFPAAASVNGYLSTPS